MTIRALPAFNGYNGEESWEQMETDDFHATQTITLGELLHDGVIVWDLPELKWDSYDEKQFWRVSEKVQEHYWDRELGVLPVRSWMREYKRKMNELMPKLKPAYAALEDPNFNFMQNSDSYSKGRTVGSSFPATQLKPNQDYASGASDSENETVNEGNYYLSVERLKDYDDLDFVLVKHVDSLFSSIWTSNINGW